MAGCRNVAAALARTPYWALYLGCAAILFALSVALPNPDVVASGAELKDGAESMLDTVKSISALVSALTTTMCAGAAATAVKGRDWSTSWRRLDGALVIVVLLCGAVSYYGLYLASIAILEMVAAGAFGIESPRLASAIALQYHSVFFGYLVLGLIFSRLMEGRLLEVPPTQT